MKRFAALIVLLAGAVWVVSALALGYFSKFDATEDLMDAFRPTFSDQGESQLADDVATANAFATDLQGKVLPALAQQAGVPADQFLVGLSQRYPAVASGIQDLPAALEFINGTAKVISDQQGNFQLVDKIPTKDQPATVTPWLFIVPGAIAIVLGAWAMIGGGGRIALILAAVLGVVVIVATVITEVPDKTKAADELTEAFDPIFDDDYVAQGRDHVTSIGQLGTQLTEQVIPGLATDAGVPVEQYIAGLGQQFPTVATGLQELPSILTRSSDLLDLIEANIDNFEKVDEIPTEDLSPQAVNWQYWIPAGVLVVFGLIGAFAPNGNANGNGNRRKDEPQAA